MTPDQLRALADALDPNKRSILCGDVELSAAAHYLRAQAEAQPVAWRCEVRDLLTQAEQCLSTAVQLEQFAYDEPPSYVSAWDYEADHIAAGIRAVLAAAPAVPQADAQPVAAVPVDWMERLKEAVKHIGYANVEKWYRLGGEDMIEQAKSDAVTAYATLCEALESLYAAPAAPQAEPIDPHMIAAEDRFPDVPAEQWVTCSQCDGDFDRECPICDGLGKVLATDGEQAEPKPTPASGDDLSVYKEMADSYRNDEPTGAPYGIIDPDYGRVYTIARKLAWEEGYAIGLHGSFTRDLDLIAVPWTDTACEPEHLIRRIVDATGLKLRDGVAVKPHGRRAWTLLFPAFGDPRFVDLSVMPRIGGSDAE